MRVIYRLLALAPSCIGKCLGSKDPPVARGLDNVRVDAGRGNAEAAPSGCNIQALPLQALPLQRLRTLPGLGVSRSQALLFVAGMGSVTYCYVRTFTREPHGLIRDDGWLCPRATVCAEDKTSLALLAISRGSAYYAYPCVVVLYLTKLRNLQAILMATPARFVLPIADCHTLHELAGYTVAGMGTLHSVCHIARFLHQDRARLFGEQTGITGLVAFSLTPLIVLPTTMPSLKKVISWEWRKVMHHLSIGWGVALALHAPGMHIVWIVGVAVVLYLIDYIYGFFKRTYMITEARVTRLEQATLLSFSPPVGFENLDCMGYLLVMVPSLTYWEWHALSVFHNHSEPDRLCLCVETANKPAGSWSVELHKKAADMAAATIYISGPYSAPFASSLQFGKLILACSGVGITPTLAIRNAYAKHKRANLLWVCRDASLVEFVLSSIAEFDDRSWTLVFYTGTRPLLLRCNLPHNVLIFKGRPNVENAMSAIVAGIESESGSLLPEELVRLQREHTAIMRHEGRRLAAKVNLTPYAKFVDLLPRALCGLSTAEIMIFDRSLAAPKDAPPPATESDAGFNIESVLTERFGDAFTADERVKLLNDLDKDCDGVVSLKDFRDTCIDVLQRKLCVRGESSRVPGQFPTTFQGLVEIGQKLAPSALAEQQKVAQHRFGNAPRNIEDPQVDRESMNLDDWLALYCGGSNDMVAAIESFSRQSGIQSKFEKFDW